MRTRLIYLTLVIGTIFLGLLSRQISFVPAFTGDFLWAVMIFLMLRVVLTQTRTFTVGIIGLTICYLVEFSQLYQADWINALRSTLPGRLVLGQGFLWTDLVAYFFGIVLVGFLDYKFHPKLAARQ